jgi:3-mercaptopyruvate sulfurtransferase SseA
MSNNRNTKQKSSLPLVMIIVGIFVVAAAVIWVVKANLTPQSAAVPNSTEAVERLNVEDAWEAYQAGDAVFVDTRDSASYAEGHIPGALLIPFEEIENQLSALDPDQQIITYCT